MIDPAYRAAPADALRFEPLAALTAIFDRRSMQTHIVAQPVPEMLAAMGGDACDASALAARLAERFDVEVQGDARARSEEHTSELQSIMRISYAVFCLKNKNYHMHTLQ